MMRRNTIVLFLLLISLKPSFAQGIRLVNAFPRLTFTKPVYLTHSGDGTNRIYVVQQNGLIRVFSNDSNVSSAATFLDISGKLSSTTGEEGLLGLAFHPGYVENGYFYVNYTTPSPRRTVVARYSASRDNPDKADSLSELRLFEVSQPYPNHNGGMLMFGLDDYLYVGLGDGGSAGDPQNRAQDLGEILGKILRVDVNTSAGSRQYGIPPDNPLVGNLRGFREEIFAWGLRNPWRFSQDPVTGEVWVGDVGQNAWEEINMLRSGGNYGWRIMEGFHCYTPSSGCDTAGLILPIKEYGHGSGNCSVTGGYVYRGARRPELIGAYIYGDFCSGRIWMLRHLNGQVIADSLLLDSLYSISSFGVDQSNELYICSLDGSILRFAGSSSVGVKDERHEFPTGFQLHQNFPNPFNPETIIKFWIARPSRVTLRVTDVLGQEVSELVEGHLGTGEHSSRFSAADLASGVYFYRIEAVPVDDSPVFREVKKLMINR